MARVPVKAELLEWAAERASTTVERLERAYPKLKIRNWVEGKSQPTLRQLEDFARLTRVPLGYLFLTNPPVETLPIPFYRSGDALQLKPSPELIETIQIMERRQDWLSEFLQDTGAMRIEYIGLHSIDDPPIAVANTMRNILKIGADWAEQFKYWTDAVSYLRDMLISAGVFVFINGIIGNNTSRPLSSREFRGFVLIDDFAPLVFVNGTDAKAAQMFTLAHEFAHVLFGKGAAFDLRQMLPADHPLELACNRVAAEFLVPAARFQESWAAITSSKVEAASRKFKVSPIVVARRALDLGLMSKDDFLSFYDEYMSKIAEIEKKRKLKSSGGDFWASQDYRVGPKFALYVHEAATKGKLNFSDAYELTGLHGSTYEHYVQRSRTKTT